MSCACNCVNRQQEPFQQEARCYDILSYALFCSNILKQEQTDQQAAQQVGLLWSFLLEHTAKTALQQLKDYGMCRSKPKHKPWQLLSRLLANSPLGRNLVTRNPFLAGLAHQSLSIMRCIICHHRSTDAQLEALVYWHVAFGPGLIPMLTLFINTLDWALHVCSVTTQEVVEAIEAQTGRKLDKRQIDLPDIRKLGTYDASIKLHPNVTGTFKVIVVREKEQR